MGLNNYEQKDLLRRIKEWNATRLDLFKISEPNKVNLLKSFFIYSYILISNHKIRP